ncbi:uncharacterized protein LOC116852607 [Odontomachus brunneus]|uniref:uncharacterized protein LOC116852607 n=1 Tax=Odontomachus brunneus TaxID=486640 RepID=UPI0013F19986|nr:uncharacterized protein LOC116852607 [Odontomachus brunneus]
MDCTEDKNDRDMITELVRARSSIRRQLGKEAIRQRGNEKGCEETTTGRNGVAPKTKKGPRITLNIQLIPPYQPEEFPPLARIPEGKKSQGREEEETRREDKAWTNVKKGSRGEKGKTMSMKMKKEPEANKGKDGKTGVQDNRIATPGGHRESRTAGTVPRRRVPKTAGTENNVSYSDALKTAREKISLTELGIDQTKIRRAINGGLLVKIGGTEGPTKAEVLAAKLREVLGPDAVVARPVIKGDLRLIGLDDSITTEEVRCVPAELGGCAPKEIKKGPIRESYNGLGTIWAQGSLSAVARVSAMGKIKIGWTIARVEPLKPRPLQCFKCWKLEHVKNNCKSTEDRSKLCYRCGQAGHNARSSSAKPSCAVCTKNGKEGNHQLGTAQCRASKPKERKSWTSYNLMVHQAMEMGVGICLISEPPRAQDSQQRFSSRDGLASILCIPDQIPEGRTCSLVKQGRGTVTIQIGELWVTSCYLSHNATRAESLVFFDELEEIAAGLDLRILNDGELPTYVHLRGSSTVDLTWVTPDVLKATLGWTVADLKTLSDHKYITFRFRMDRSQAIAGARARRFPGWNVRKFDPETFSAALEWSGREGPPEAESPEVYAKWLQERLQEACDLAATRTRKCFAKHQVYWWNAAIEALRRECVNKRRSLIRLNRRSTRHKKRAGSPGRAGQHQPSPSRNPRREPDELTSRLAEEAYKEAKRNLHKEIARAKTEAWHELINSIEADSWGLPYRLVLKKLKGASSAVTETLKADALETVLNGLFPSGETHEP